MLTTFTTSPDHRFFEDYTVGATYECGSFTVTEAEITDFAERYDPQAMHVDRAWAAQGPFGQVIASGWHTVACTMRLLVDHFLPRNGLAAPGIDELRWPRPVRPGDRLTLFVTVEQARRSRTRPDRGLIQTLLELKNQDGEVVLSMRPTNFVRVREVVRSD
jgi:acyl dehydratase